MAQAEGVTPSQEDLLAELQALKLANPEMGAKKLQAAVKEKNPTWLVSEARVKKVATEAGLLAPAPEKPAADAAAAGGSAAAPAASKKPAKAKAQTRPEPTVPIAEVYPTGDWPVGEIMEYTPLPPRTFSLMLRLPRRRRSHLACVQVQREERLQRQRRGEEAAGARHGLRRSGEGGEVGC